MGPSHSDLVKSINHSPVPEIRPPDEMYGGVTVSQPNWRHTAAETFRAVFHQSSNWLRAMILLAISMYGTENQNAECAISIALLLATASGMVESWKSRS